MIYATDYRALVSALLAGLAAISIAPADTLARVGVTSGSEGDPLGKPPTRTNGYCALASMCRQTSS